MNLSKCDYEEKHDKYVSEVIDFLNNTFKLIKSLSDKNDDFECYQHEIDSFSKLNLKEKPELALYIYSKYSDNLIAFLKSVELPIEMEIKYQNKKNISNINREGEVSHGKH